MFVDVFALAGADVGPGATDSSPSLTASLAGASAGTLGFRFIGGGRFLPTGLVAGGAIRVGIGGSGSGGDSVGCETFSWSSLKLRLERMGIVPRAQTPSWSGKAALYRLRGAASEQEGARVGGGEWRSEVERQEGSVGNVLVLN